MSREYADNHGLLGELKRAFGENGIHWSCLGWDGERKLKHLVLETTRALPEPESLPHILEIGTHRGVSSVILSHFGTVTTFDVHDWPLRHKIHDHFGVTNRVTCVVCENAEQVHREIARLDFDIAFIDGCHSYEAVRMDFAAVRRCGRVIFHDYEPRLHGQRTVRFVDNLRDGRTTKLMPFALWESPEVIGVNAFQKIEEAP